MTLTRERVPRNHTLRVDCLLDTVRAGQVMGGRAVAYAQLLTQIPIFVHLQGEELEHLSALLRPRHYDKGEVVFHQGDVGTALYIIRKGQVAIRISSDEGKEVLLTMLDRGCCFGELALLDGKPRATDAVAHEESELLILQREDFQRFLDARPQAAKGLLSELSRMVRHVTLLVHDATFLDARTRMARVLLELAESQGKPRR